MTTATTQLMWSDTMDSRSAVTTSDGRILANYIWHPRWNHPYFDGIRPLSHDGILNNHAPWDHRWHLGLWWSWKFINDILFWEDHPDYGGNRAGLGRSVVLDHRIDNTDRPRLSQHLSWRVDESRAELLTERRTLTLCPQGVGDHAGWALDWDLAWTATVDTHLTTTPYPEVSWGGYAGLNFRPARSMRDREQILANGDRDDVTAIHGAHGSWGSYTGCVDGAGDDHPAEPSVGGVAILEHPDNMRFPGTLYAATASGGFGFLAAAPLLAADLYLRQGEELRLRYRTHILDHPPDHRELDEAHAVYAAIHETAI